MPILASAKCLSKLKIINRPQTRIKRVHYIVILLLVTSLMCFINKCNLVWNFHRTVLPWLINRMKLTNINILWNFCSSFNLLARIKSRFNLELVPIFRKLLVNWNLVLLCCARSHRKINFFNHGLVQKTVGPALGLHLEGVELVLVKSWSSCDRLLNNFRLGLKGKCIFAFWLSWWEHLNLNSFT